MGNLCTNKAGQPEALEPLAAKPKPDGAAQVVSDSLT